MKTSIDIKDVGEELAAEEVAGALRAGGLAVTPTDTVYGLAVLVYEPGKPCADVWRKPYDKLVVIKRRAGPFIILLPYWEAASAFTEDDISSAAALTETYRKPVTFLFNGRRYLSERMLGPEGEVALRVVSGGFIKELVKRIGPIFSTSANSPEEKAPRSLGEVDTEIRTAAAVEVDGGAATEEPSAVIDATAEPFIVVRSAPGLEAVLHNPGTGRFDN